MTPPLDFNQIKGNQHAVRILEAAAVSRGTNVVLEGPPGCGATMLARRWATILPPMSPCEHEESTMLYAMAGALCERQTDENGLSYLRTEPPHYHTLDERPFRAPHYTISTVAIEGSLRERDGSYVARPGEATLAHNGVLFLDEYPEFDQRVQELVRYIWQEQESALFRFEARLPRRENNGCGYIEARFPATFRIVYRIYPCPCGYHGTGLHECLCSDAQIEAYKERAYREIVGPFMHASVGQMPYWRDKNDDTEPNEDSATIRARVIEERERNDRNSAYLYEGPYRHQQRRW